MGNLYPIRLTELLDIRVRLMFPEVPGSQAKSKDKDQIVSVTEPSSTPMLPSGERLLMDIEGSIECGLIILPGRGG